MSLIMETPQVFKTAEEKAEHYRKMTGEYKRKLSETQKELEEFQVSSRDLEVELETQLEQTEKKNKELSLTNRQLKMYCERLQGKLQKCQTESSRTISGLQGELDQLKLVRDDLQQYVRKLEQKNDDFERSARASLMSVEDFETRLNQAIERNAFLENELDEKENMAVLIQRLKDEARDLKQELLINETPHKIPDTPPPSPCNKSIESIIDNNRIFLETERARLRRNSTRPNFVPSTVPQSALNIVGDLLKKVGAFILSLLKGQLHL